MKNKLLKKLLVIFLNLFFVNLVSAKNIEFKATSIRISLTVKPIELHTLRANL